MQTMNKARCRKERNLNDVDGDDARPRAMDAARTLRAFRRLPAAAGHFFSI